MAFDYDHPIFHNPVNGPIVQGVSKEKLLDAPGKTRIRFEVEYEGQCVPVVADLYTREVHSAWLRVGRLIDVGGLPVDHGNIVVSCEADGSLVVEFRNHM